ncbi:MAG TPA: hypothetical protein VJ570_14780 [Holophagaceae bacterium]|nr:hypothetical protein [Holophagaceae bacterium]
MTLHSASSLRSRSLIGAALALLLSACGGGSSAASRANAGPAVATGLKYTNPAATGWRLEQDPISTPTHLVLRLVGPSGTLTRGAAFNLQSDAAKMAWGKLNGLYVEDLGIFELAADPTDPNEPRLLVGGLKDGLLSVADLQKHAVYTAKEAGQPLFRVAIDFKASANLHAGDPIPLAVTKAKSLRDDFLSETITPAAGSLVAQ